LLTPLQYRIIFRLVQFCSKKGSPFSNYIDHHEFFVYVFDAIPMFFALVLMNIWHPGKVLKGKTSEKAFVYTPPDYARSGFRNEQQYQMNSY